MAAAAALLAALVIGDRIRRFGPTWPGGAPASTVGARDDVARYDGKTFRVTRAVDGDTLHVDAPDEGKTYTKIRLWGVDTPEVYDGDEPMYFGPQASAFVRSAADKQEVRLELVPGRTRDRYGRLLAYVHLPDGGMLNRRLVAEGYAYADTRFAHPYRNEFVELERQARQERLGLWREVTRKKMPAWRQKIEDGAAAGEARR